MANKFPRIIGRLAAAGLLSFVAACSGSDAGHWVGDYVTDNDFEAMRGWLPDASSLTRDHAHSGQFATYVGPEREYGLTFDLPLREASVHTLKGVAVEAWVYLPTPEAAASLEVQVPLAGPDSRMGFAGSIKLSRPGEGNCQMDARPAGVCLSGGPARRCAPAHFPVAQCHPGNGLP